MVKLQDCEYQLFILKFLIISNISQWSKSPYNILMGIDTLYAAECRKWTVYWVVLPTVVSAVTSQKIGLFYVKMSLKFRRRENIQQFTHDLGTISLFDQVYELISDRNIKSCIMRKINTLTPKASTWPSIIRFSLVISTRYNFILSIMSYAYVLGYRLLDSLYYYSFIWER